MDNRQIIDEFVVESCDHLADIESQLLAIEAGGQTADIELVNTVFRDSLDQRGRRILSVLTHSRAFA